MPLEISEELAERLARIEAEISRRAAFNPREPNERSGSEPAGSEPAGHLHHPPEQLNN
jgi:hypothetical protein